MSFMFDTACFNKDISSWNTSHVVDMTAMFAYSQFNGNISQWNISNVINMEGMFNGCYNEFIPDWAILDEKTQKFKDSLKLNNELEYNLSSQNSNKSKLKI